MYLFVSNDASREFYNKETELCMQNSPLKQPFCRCFAKSLKPIFLKDASQLPSYYVDNAHHWISDHWVSTHQIAHWIEKLALLHSIFLKPEGYQFSFFLFLFLFLFFDSFSIFFHGNNNII